jgi:hypothetical protein
MEDTLATGTRRTPTAAADSLAVVDQVFADDLFSAKERGRCHV